MIWIVILFIVGIICTVKGGDWFVDAATWLAEATGIPKFIIGATIVSVATTLPELLVSSIATMQGRTGMAIGNAVGSVNCNTGLILALTAVFMSGAVDRRQFQNKGILLVLSCAALLGFSRGGSFGLFGAAVMFAILLLFVTDSIFAGKTSNEIEERPEISRNVLIHNLILFAAGAGSMVIGARLMVDNGAIIARTLGIPETIIGLTLVAIGTSLPELVTTITAIVKKQSDISVGNILGANVLNMCMVLPVSSLISNVRFGTALPVEAQNIAIDMPMTILISSIAVIPTLITGKIKRWQGILLIATYVSYVVYITFIL